MMNGQQVIILKEGTQRNRGRDARKMNINAAIAIADIVKTTLGPKGMDKMLVDSMGDVTITNDGATILKDVDIEHPAAKMLVEVSKTQEDECGDGTTTAVVIAGELLRKADEMVGKNIHPTAISAGYSKALKKSLELLEKSSIRVDIKDAATLEAIAQTAMMSKGVSSNKEMLGKVAVGAVQRVVEERNGKMVFDEDNIQIIKKHGGSMESTELIEGIIIDKEKVHTGMPAPVKDAKIALLDCALEIKKTEVESKIQIHDPSQLQKFLEEEEHTLKTMVDTIKKSGATVVVCQKGIDDLVQHYLAKEGIYAVRRAKKSDLEKLAKATGGFVVSKLSDLSAEDLGHAASVDEKKIGDDKMTYVTGCKNPKAVTILIRGTTEHVVAEIERSLDDAISVVGGAIEDGKIVTGGGSTAVEISMRLKEYAMTVGGREKLAIDAYAEALEVIPRTLAENAGLDPIDVVIKMRKAHKEGHQHYGVNIQTGEAVDMLALRVIEPFRVGKQALGSATEAAIMILRIDDVIASKGREPGAGGPGGMPPGMGGMGGMGGM